jgi:hypothetical protein
MDKPRLIGGIPDAKGVIVEVADVLYRMRRRKYFERFEAEILPLVRNVDPHKHRVQP